MDDLRVLIGALQRNGGWAEATWVLTEAASEITRLRSERDEAVSAAEIALSDSGYHKNTTVCGEVDAELVALRSANALLIAVAEAAQNFLDHGVDNTPRYFALMTALAALSVSPTQADEVPASE